MAKQTHVADEFRTMLKTQPFAPFLIKTSDGDTIEVIHPDYALLSPQGRTAHVYDRDEHYRIINMQHVVTLEPKRAKKGMLGQGPGKK